VPALDGADDEEPPTCERVMGVDPKFAKPLSAEFNSAIAREAVKTEWADRSSDNVRARRTGNVAALRPSAGRQEGAQHLAKRRRVHRLGQALVEA
jgi:hypothetical protein